MSDISSLLSQLVDEEMISLYEWLSLLASGSRVVPYFGYHSGLVKIQLSPNF